MLNFFGSDMIYRIPALLIAITFHEFSHAIIADKLGDPTPRMNGRLTLNPISHLDPIGLIMLWIFKFGWAKPVPINPRYFINPKRGMLYVALAGPLSNILLAFITLLIMKIINLQVNSTFYILLNLVLVYNVFLAVFNLMPVPPLDGSKIVGSLLPNKYLYQYSQLETYAPIILIVLLYFGFLGRIMTPFVNIIFYSIDFLTSFIINLGGILLL